MELINVKRNFAGKTGLYFNMESWEHAWDGLEINLEVNLRLDLDFF